MALRPSCLFAVAAVVVFAVARLTAAQPCEGVWLAGDPYPGVNGIVRAMVRWDPDGEGPQPELLVIGGSFTIAGSVQARNIAAWDGVNWLRLGDGLGPGYADAGAMAINALAVYNGQLIAAGGFSQSTAPPFRFIARWDGQAWQPLTTAGAGPSNIINALTVYRGDLYAGGEYNLLGTQAIARWNGQSWQGVGTGFTGHIFSMAVYNDELYVGGHLSLNNNTPGTNGIARWDGAAWSGVGGGTGPGDFAAHALAVHNGELIAGGAFTVVAGQNLTGQGGTGMAANRLAAWNGTTWRALGAGVNGWVWLLASVGGELYAGGDFSGSGDNARTLYGSARWNAALSRWEEINTASHMFGRIYCADAFAGQTTFGGNLYVGGNGTPQRNLLRIEGQAWGPTPPSFNAPITDFEEFRGELFAAGWFTTAHGVSASRIAAWNGQTWRSVGPAAAAGTGLTSSDNGRYVLTKWRNDLFVGGPFYRAGGLRCNQIARWDGAAWSSLETGLTATTFSNPTVQAMTDFRGSLIVGGHFTGAGSDTDTRNIASWDGQVWHRLGNGLGVSQGAGVQTLAVYQDTLYAGGDFGVSGGAITNYLAAWDGTAWRQFGGGVNFYVTALVVFGDRLIVAGSFNRANDLPITSIATWDGAAWGSMPGAPTTASALHIVNGALYASAGTGLWKWDGQSWARLTSWSADGGIMDLTSFGGELIAGGTFIRVNANGSAYWARQQGPCAADFNCSGSAGLQDVFDFLGAWFGAQSAADINGDSSISLQDIFDFLEAWFGGC